MESRVEGHHLRNRREHLRNGVDTQQVGGIVQRGEVAADADLLDDIVIDQGTAAEEIGTLHDPVTDRIDIVKRLQHARLRIHQGVQDEFHALCVVCYRQFLYNLLAARRCILEDTFRQSDLFYDSFGDEGIGIIALHVQKLVFDGRASAIDNKYNHFCNVFSV